MPVVDIKRVAAAAQQEVAFAIAIVAAECRALPLGGYDAAIVTRRSQRELPISLFRVTLAPGSPAVRVVPTPLGFGIERGELSDQRVEKAVVGFVDADHDGSMESWVALVETMQTQEACCETAEQAAREWSVDSIAVRGVVIDVRGEILGEKVFIEGTGDRVHDRAQAVFGTPYEVESPARGELSFTFSCDPDDGFPGCRDDVRAVRWRL